MLEQVSPSIWTVTDQLAMPGKIIFPIRMNIIRLQENRLMLHSPIEINDQLAEEIEKLGQVSWLVGPNNLHHLFLEIAIRRWPEARVIAAPGLSAKQPDLEIHQSLTDQTPSEWRDELDLLFIEGIPFADETVFYHRKDKVLMLTDLIFNMHDAPNFRTRLLLKCVGAWQKVGQSRLLKMMVKDRKAAGASTRKLFDWDFEKVLMAHGAVVDNEPQKQLRPALEWMMRA